MADVRFKSAPAPAFNARGIAASNIAMQDSLKYAMSGVDALLKHQQDTAVEENTNAMRVAISKDIANNGLAAPPTDTNAIKAKFGSLINIKDVQEADKTERAILQNDVNNTASSLGLQKFQETGNIADATETYRKSVKLAGGDDALANTMTKDFRAANQYRAVDDKSNMLRKIAEDSAELKKEFAIGGDETLIDDYVKDYPKHQQVKARELLKSSYINVGKLDELDKEKVADVQKTMDTNDKIIENRYQQKVRPLQAAYDATEDFSPEVLTRMRQLKSLLPGDLQTSKDGEFSEGVFAAIYNSVVGTAVGTTTGTSARKKMEEDVRNIKKDYGLNTEEALLVTAQAYLSQKAQGGQFVWGNGIKDEVYENLIPSIAKNVQKRKFLATEISKLGSEYESTKLQTLERQSKEMRTLKKSLRSENFGGKSVNIEQFIKNLNAKAGVGTSGATGTSGSTDPQAEKLKYTAAATAGWTPPGQGPKAGVFNSFDGGSGESPVGNSVVGGQRATTYPNGLQKVGGNKNWRNNNPANIKYGSFAENNGAIGKDSDGFAIFPTMEAGRQGQISLLKSSGYSNLPLDEVIAKWAPATDDNDVDAYRAAVLKNTGFPGSTKLSDLSDAELGKFADAMAAHEGKDEGTVTYPDGTAFSAKGISTKTNNKDAAQKLAEQINAAGKTAEAEQYAKDHKPDGIEVAKNKNLEEFHGSGKDEPMPLGSDVTPSVTEKNEKALKEATAKLTEKDIRDNSDAYQKVLRMTASRGQVMSSKPNVVTKWWENNRASYKKDMERMAEKSKKVLETVKKTRQSVTKELDSVTSVKEKLAILEKAKQKAGGKKIHPRIEKMLKDLRKRIERGAAAIEY